LGGLGETKVAPVDDLGLQGRQGETKVAPVDDVGLQGRQGETKVAPVDGGETYRVPVLGREAPLEVSGPRERRIATIATAQRGRVSHRQLRAAGISKAEITGLLKRGAIFGRGDGVYAVGHVAPIELGDETAALLSVHNRAGLSHHSAGKLWELLPPTAGDGLIHVVIRSRCRCRPDGVVVHRSDLLTPGDIWVRHGLPVTSPAWTLLDLAEVLLERERELELAFDRAVVSRIVRAQEITAVLKRAHKRAGRRPLQRLLDRERGPTVTRSEAEERFLALVRSAQLPQPQVNARIHGYEVDFLWPARLIVEVDGFRYHSTRRAFEHDHRKDAVLRGAGLPVLRFTWDQVDRAPLQVIAAVARELALPDRRR
jgi:very-short-patch-repair endonuclease